MKLFYSIRYTRINQLYYRLKYLIRRKIRELFPLFYRSRLTDIDYSSYSINTAIPKPVLPPRKGIIKKRDSAFELEFLNSKRKFSIPFDWHPVDLEGNASLWKFNLHYMEFLEETNDKDFQDIVEDWISHNPPYNKNYGLGNWNSYVISLRTLVWMQQYSVRNEKLDKNFKNTLTRSLLQQIRFLHENLELDIVGNHLMKNIKTLLWAAKFFIGPGVYNWKNTGEKLLENQLEEQILNDGMHFELSPSYHCQVFIDLLEIFTVIQNNSLKQKLESTLLKMMQTIKDFTHPDGKISLFNDGGLNMSYSPEVCLEAGERIMGKKVSSNLILKYPDSGYYGINRNDFKIIIDAGRTGPDFLPAHSHGDILSFELSYKGKRYFVDTGVFEYTAGKKRNYSRSTPAHNTVNISGFDQCDFYGSFRLGRRANVIIDKFAADENSMIISAFHDGYKWMEGNPIHNRKFIINQNNITIEDVIKGGKGQQTESRILLHPECQVEVSERELVIRRNSDYIVLSTNSDFEIIPAVWFPDFGKEIITKQVAFHYGSAPCSAIINIFLKPVPELSYVSDEDKINIK